MNHKIILPFFALALAVMACGIQSATPTASLRLSYPRTPPAARTQRHIHPANTFRPDAGYATQWNLLCPIL